MEAVLAVSPLVLILFAASWSLSSLSRQAKQHAEQLRAIDRRLRLVMDHLGVVEPTPALPPAVFEHLAAGRKIQAIKEYRAATGVGLKEAKDAVEAMGQSVVR